MKKYLTIMVVVVGIIFVNGCSTSTYNHVNDEYKLSVEEQAAWGKGIIQYFSNGLPNYAYDATIVTPYNLKSSISYIVRSIGKHGKLVSNDGVSEVSGRVGSGSLNMNPAGILVKLEPVEGGTKLFIRAVAKEGVIKQNTSGKAVERLIADIEQASKSKAQRM